MSSNPHPRGLSISPTGLDAACQCDSKLLYEKHGANPIPPYAMGAVALGSAVHKAVENLHNTGKPGATATRLMVPSKKAGPQPVGKVAQRILDVCHERFAGADAWAVEQKFAFYCDSAHSVYMRGKTDYAPFTAGRCDAVIDLKTKAGVSPKLGDTLVSLDMHRQLFACAISCMAHSRDVILRLERSGPDDAPTDSAYNAVLRKRPPNLGTWDNPIPYEVIADAIDNAPLPEVWILIWDKDGDRPVWRAHWISRAALRAQIKLACDKAQTHAEYFDEPPATWPRSFNCSDPAWDCPHKARCTNDLADPLPHQETVEQDLALVVLGARR